MKNQYLSLIFLVVSTAVFAQNGEGVLASKKDDPEMQWWKEAKFGMFIHWGIYPVPAGKWDDKTSYLNDNDPKNKWQSAPNDTLAWVQVDLKIPLNKWLCSR